MTSHSQSSRYPPSSRTHTPPTTSASQVTVVHDPHQHRPSAPSSPTEEYYSSSSPTQSTPVLPHAPSPPSILSDNETYGPQRVHGPSARLPPVQYVQEPMKPRPAVRFNTAQAPFSMAAAQDPSLARDFKDDLARAAGVVTPGVDDSPYIQYALHLMTKRHGEPADDDEGEHESERSPGTGIAYPGVQHTSPDATTGLGVFQPAPAYIPPNPAETRRTDRSRIASGHYAPIAPEPQTAASDPYSGHRAQRQISQQIPSEFQTVPLDRHDKVPRDAPQPVGDHEPLLARDSLLPRELRRWQAVPDTFDTETGSRNESLTYKPRILQTPSLLALAVLNICMIAALMFCAIYSRTQNGLWSYSGNLNNGDYFVFRILPQLLGAVVLVYSQCVTSVAFRIMPFAQLASDDARVRERAVFQPMYLKSFLLPKVMRDWKMTVIAVNTWLLNLTIPLLSSIFTVILKDGQWTWATGQAVTWTLVVLYAISTLSTLFMQFTWRRKRTGLRDGWDLRSLADFILLAAQSNSASKYRSTEVMATRDRMRDWFSGKDIERLGFWNAPESSDPWYGLGVEETIVDEKMSARLWARGQGDSMSVASGVSGMPIAQAVRSRYLPWCLRSGQVVSAALAATVLAVVLIAVSSAKLTSIRLGFLPTVPAGADRDIFSAANFLWTFVPSLLGMILFLAFQSFDLELRILTAWGELARQDGSRAETSLLLDYAAASMPWEATLKAIKNKHWRVAFVSFVAPGFILIPVLAGGMFIALTVSSSDPEVRMFPQMIAFGIFLGLLALYAVAFACLVPNRKQFRLPHAVSSLAEVLSFCSNHEIRNDTAFADFPQQKGRALERRDLEARLDVGQDWHRQGRWTFSYGRNNDERLGIKRYSRFTVNPRRLRQYDRRTRGELISQPMQQQQQPGFLKNDGNNRRQGYSPVQH
ncbi:hypothetical protein Micbo1qcDRAFT_231662 [Microdochium bolleyi]|uniref:Phosphoribosylaminoimidazole-succinocarboxamide synthase n=1 Tax=Microdochium bolleyi TaxID=196109 RepID=A0A136JAM8_9PEZI|nr:hypothetical protein Micbo1qcDRAFT_231662 [Microdochium bolleyi]